MLAEMLDFYGFDYEVASTYRQNLAGLAWELLEHDYRVYRIAKKFKPDLLIGTSVAAAHIAPLVGAKSLIFSEDDANIVPLFKNLTYPFASRVIIPDCLSDNPKANYVTHSSYHELCYLHPNNFTPNPMILKRLGLAQGEPYYILRLTSLKAHHDVGQQGISRDLYRQIVEYLSENGKVFVSNEVKEKTAPTTLSIPFHLMHHALYYANLVIGDSQTMAIESAVLGTPSIRCNSFDDISVLSELEDKYKLSRHIYPSQHEAILDGIKEQLNLPNDTWIKRKQKLLADKVDFLQWILRFVDSVVGV